MSLTINLFGYAMIQIDWVLSFLLNRMVGYSQTLSSLSAAEFAEKSKGTMEKNGKYTDRVQNGFGQLLEKIL